MEKLKLGIIGCGGMMSHHVSRLLTFEDVQITAVADPRAERAEAMQKRTGAVKVYASHKELFAGGDKLDAVYIAVEPTAHDGIEEECIARGLPFMVEKPMTMCLEQAKKITDAVKAKGLVTAVGFQDRYLAVTDRIKKELSDMKVGLVYGSWFGGVPQVWWWMKKATCGGQLYEQNIHLLDQLRYFFGEAEKVYAVSGRTLIDPKEFPDTLPAYDTDDFSTAVITFKNGVVANLMSCCYVTGKGNPIRNGLTIIGRDKSLEYSLRNSVTVYEAGREEKIVNQTDQSDRHARAFLDAVKVGDPTAVRSPYPDAYETLRLAAAANESIASGNAVFL
ncbi:MAG: Gfo/Idh/MocA family oxidoreductase [Defluviitaleaceae bacterium]|nr:Gfo/Idh/MocA family oxidoreductase [Defluviitaleaceae bacterium]